MTALNEWNELVLTEMSQGLCMNCSSLKMGRGMRRRQQQQRAKSAFKNGRHGGSLAH